MKRTLKIKGALIILSMIVLVGLAGGLEQDMLTIGQYITCSVIALAVLAISVKSVKV